MMDRRLAAGRRRILLFPTGNDMLNEEERLNPGHHQFRAVLRVVGPAVFVLGVVFTGIGMISFFSAMGSFEPPRYFWCCFVGMPLMGIGGMLTKIGYLGAMYRYLAGEAAPVQKDTFNYLARGTSPGIKELTRAVRDGWRDDPAPSSSQPQTGAFCPQCGQPTGAQANFCSACGTKLE